MAEAEEIIIDLINRAFDGIKPIVNDYQVESWREFTDEWIEENKDIFMYYSHDDELFLLPAFLCYLLRNFRTASQSTMYITIEGTLECTLREYSKCTRKDCFKYSLTNAQFSAIKAFIKHCRYNMPVNIDKEQWGKILKGWKRGR